MASDRQGSDSKQTPEFIDESWDLLASTSVRYQACNTLACMSNKRVPSQVESVIFEAAKSLRVDVDCVVSRGATVQVITLV